MARRRQKQIGELIHQEISQTLQFNSHDPRLKLVTVTGVEVTPDLELAKVFVTVWGDASEEKQTLAALEKAAGYVRYQLGQTLKLRHIPELTFKLDKSLEYGMRIDRLLDTLHIKPEVVTNDDPEP